MNDQPHKLQSILTDLQSVADHDTAQHRRLAVALGDVGEQDLITAAIDRIVELSNSLTETRQERDTLATLGGRSVQDVESPTLCAIQAAAVLLNWIPRGHRRGDALGQERYLRARGWGFQGAATWRDPETRDAFIQESALDIQLRRDLEPFKSLTEGLGRSSAIAS